MKLKKIYMYGFKSFANRTEIEIKDGMTAVVGPNGSGKSNIVDAIRWVLGEQSVKSLRGVKSQDIIFAGTQFRKLLSYAEVSIVFDNTDGSIPLEFDEVKVTRKLYRDGESGYYLNGEQTRLKTIQEIFMDTGIGKDGYSIIGQGRIDEILSNNSEERRKVFEEATGIVKYRERRKEAVKNIENTNENLDRVNDIIDEIEDRIVELEKKAQKARAHIDLMEKKKKIDLRVFKESMEIISDKKGIITQELKEIEAKIEATRNEIYSEENKKVSIEKEIYLIEKETEENYGNIGKIIEELSEKEKKAKELEDKIHYLKENIKRIEEETIEANGKIENLELEKEKRKEKLLKFSNDKKVFEDELEEKIKELDKEKKESNQKEIQANQLQKEIEELEEEIYEVEEQIREKQIELIKREEKSDSLEKMKKEYIREKDLHIFKLEEETKKFVEENKDLLKHIQEIESKIEVLKNKREEYNMSQKQKNSILTEMEMLKQRIEILDQLEKEKDGYSQAVKKIMTKEAFEKSEVKRSVLAEKISVEEGYSEAIEVALGYTLQNIIVDTEEDAKNLIEYLKNEKLGRATFLPLTKFKHTDENIKIENGKITGKTKEEELLQKSGITSDKYITAVKVLKKINKETAPILLYFLKGTVIADTLENAIEISKKVKGIKVVTREGELFSTTGSITGGYNKKVSNVIGRKTEIDKLAKKYNKLKEEVEDLEQKNAEMKVKVEENKKEEDNLQKEIYNQRLEVAFKEKGIKDSKNKIEEYNERIDNLEKENIEILKERELIKQELEITEENKAKIVSKRDELKNNRQEIVKQLSNDEKVEKLEEITEEITNLRISVASYEESEKSVKEILDSVEENYNELIEKRKKRDKEKNFSIQEIEEAKRLLETTTKEIEEVSLKNQQVKEMQEEIKERKQDHSERLQHTIKKIEELEQKIGVMLPKKISKEQEIFKIDLEKENQIEFIWNEYETTLNNIEINEEDIYYEEIHLNQRDMENKIVGFDIVRAKKIKKDLILKIKEIGEVDTGTIKEYEVVKERYDYLTEQRNDLEKTKKSLEKVIKDISETMEEQFTSRLEMINENFGNVFKELFGGGKGRIELEEPENPLTSGINIRVEPPGKKLQNMMLLSGGERAFTAIAILFAILKINPSPFCVLDEIEAALDDINVQRVAEYLKNYSKETQFLVITHRKGTMEASELLYGVTMEENGVSKLVSLDLR